MVKGKIFQEYYSVNEKVYNGFINVFKDNNILHTDEMYAKKKKFKGLVMHGNILNGFLSHFIGECLPKKNVIIHGQSIKYHKPVYLDDKLCLKVIVQEVYSSVNVVKLTFSFINSEGILNAKGTIQIGVI